VFDFDSTFFGKDILDFGGFDAVPSSPSDGELCANLCAPLHAELPNAMLQASSADTCTPIAWSTYVQHAAGSCCLPLLCDEALG